MDGAGSFPATHFADQYDYLVLDSFMRSYFGPSGYFNVGYSTPDVVCQEEACRKLTDRLIEKLPARAGMVLDVGCGLGATTRRLAELRPQVRILALNISFQQLAFCRRNCPGAMLLQADATRIGLASGSMDAVLCVEAAFHFRTRTDFLAEASRILRPGGVLMIADILFEAGAWPGSWSVPAENHLSGPDVYRQLLRSMRFEEIQIEDATEPCWKSFCLNLMKWLEQEQDTIDGSILNLWKAATRELISAARYYLLISAIRSAN